MRKRQQNGAGRTFQNGDRLFLDSEVINFDQQAAGNTPGRRRELEQDPVFGLKKPFAPDQKRRSQIAAARSHDTAALSSR